MRVKAMFVVGLAGGERAATAQVELLPHEGEGAAQRPGIGEGSKISGAVFLAQPSQGKARDGIVQVDLQEEKAFVIAETDVVTRMKFLDQLAFEEQCLRLAPDHVHIKIVDGLDEGAELE